MPKLTVNRAIAVVACGLFFAVATILLMADRAGSLVWMLKRAVIETGQRIEAAYDIDVIDRQDIPGDPDQLLHAALWGSGMVLIGWLSRRMLPIPFTALLMAGASLAFEMAQPVFSSTRVFQPSDVVGNVVGIVGAAILLALAMGIHRITFGHRRVIPPIR